MADEENQANHSENPEEPKDDDLQHQDDSDTVDSEEAAEPAEPADETGATESDDDTPPQSSLVGTAPILAMFPNERINDLSIETEIGRASCRERV